MKFTSHQGIKNVLASIRTFHSACGYSIPSPTEDYSLHHALRGARKYLSRPFNQKLPINSRFLAALLAQFDVDSPFRFLMLLSYLTFLRISLRKLATYPITPYDPVFSFKTSATWTLFTRTRALKTALATAGLNSSSFAWSSFRRGPTLDYLVAGGDVEFPRMHGDLESLEFRKYLAIPSAHRARVSSTLQDLF